MKARTDLQAHSPVEFGRRIGVARKEAGFTQNELAKRCGFPTGYVSRIESGKVGGKRPTASLVQVLCGVLRIRREWLLRGESPMRESGVAVPDAHAETTRDRVIAKWRSGERPIPNEVVERVMRNYAGPAFDSKDEDFWDDVIRAEVGALWRELAVMRLGPPKPAEPPKPAAPEDPFTANDPSPSQVGKPPKSEPVPERQRVGRRRRR